MGARAGDEKGEVMPRKLTPPASERYTPDGDHAQTVAALKLADRDEAIALHDAALQAAYHAGIIRGIDIARETLTKGGHK